MTVAPWLLLTFTSLCTAANVGACLALVGSGSCHSCRSCVGPVLMYCNDLQKGPWLALQLEQDQIDAVTSVCVALQGSSLELNVDRQHLRVVSDRSAGLQVLAQ
jgi:hypothetical protein